MGAIVTGDCSESNLGLATELFALVMDNCANDPFILGLAYDELALCLERHECDSTFVSFVHEKVQLPFIESYILDEAEHIKLAIDCVSDYAANFPDSLQKAVKLYELEVDFPKKGVRSNSKHILVGYPGIQDYLGRNRARFAVHHWNGPTSSVYH
jgi:hypothetical protein